MKLSVVASALICAEVALGLSSTELRRESRIARRLAELELSDGTRQSRPLIASPPGLEGYDLKDSNKIEYNVNWAGAALESTNFTLVTAVVVVPTLTAISNGSNVGTAVSFLSRRGLVSWTRANLYS